MIIWRNALSVHFVIVALVFGCRSRDERLQDASLRQQRILDLESIQREGCRAGVQWTTLISLLSDSDPAIRYFAAGAIDRVDSGSLDLASQVEICYALVPLLDDAASGRFSVETPLGAICDGVTPGVRTRALAALVKLSGRDHGFDRDAWKHALDAWYAQVHSAGVQNVDWPSDRPADDK